MSDGSTLQHMSGPTVAALAVLVASSCAADPPASSHQSSETTAGALAVPAEFAGHLDEAWTVTLPDTAVRCEIMAVPCSSTVATSGDGVAYLDAPTTGAFVVVLVDSHTGEETRSLPIAATTDLQELYDNYQEGHDEGWLATDQRLDWWPITLDTGPGVVLEQSVEDTAGNRTINRLTVVAAGATVSVLLDATDPPAEISGYGLEYRDGVVTSLASDAGGGLIAARWGPGGVTTEHYPPREFTVDGAVARGEAVGMLAGEVIYQLDSADVAYHGWRLSKTSDWRPGDVAESVTTLDDERLLAVKVHNWREDRSRFLVMDAATGAPRAAYPATPCPGDCPDALLSVYELILAASGRTIVADQTLVLNPADPDAVQVSEALEDFRLQAVTETALWGCEYGLGVTSDDPGNTTYRVDRATGEIRDEGHVLTPMSVADDVALFYDAATTTLLGVPTG